MPPKVPVLRFVCIIHSPTLDHALIFHTHYLVCLECRNTVSLINVYGFDVYTFFSKFHLTNPVVMKKVGRNDLCPCGSGKKYKNCHASIEKSKALNNKSLLYIGLLLAFLAIAAYSLFFAQKSTRPNGPAPAGKVWSEEHGHYH
tara:strand:- start:42 stop:473 length:432 start_codon:yes stop_codon:yes gene_type:complete